MALTVTTDRANPGEALVKCAVTFDSSYATGGEDFLPASVEGVSDIDAVVVVSHRANTTWRVQWDSTNNKLLAFVQATGLQVANAVDLSTLVVDVLVFAG